MKLVLTAEKRKCYLFLCIVYLFIFQDWIVGYVPLMKYFDEVFSLYAMFYLMVNCRNKNTFSDNAVPIRIGIFVGITIFIGFLSSLRFRYQPMRIVFSDMLLVLKFFLAMYVGGKAYTELFRITSIRKIISANCVILAVLFLIFVVADYVFDIFPKIDKRYGLESIQLFYSHCTVLVASMVVLISVYVLATQEKTSLFIVLIICTVISSTLRSKAFGIAIISLGIFCLVIKGKIRIKRMHIALGIIAVLFVTWGQLQYYYGRGTEEFARNLLTTTSVEIMRDHFPFGAGFGSYASHFSAVEYSPIYRMYGLSTAQGLMKGQTGFVSDTFWPMIIGQFGLFGTVFYTLALTTIISAIQKVQSKNRYVYASSIIAIAYLLISSTSESAFVNSFAVPLGMVVGIGLNYFNRHS